MRSGSVLLFGVVLAGSGCKNALNYGQPGSLDCDAPGAICSFGPQIGVGDGGPALEASLVGPSALSRGANGALLIADRFQNRLRRIDASGEIETVAGNGRNDLAVISGLDVLSVPVASPIAVAETTDGFIFWAESRTCSIYAIDPATDTVDVAAGVGSCAGPAAFPSAPFSTAFRFGDCPVLTADGDNLYIADTNNFGILYWNRGVADVSVANVNIPAGQVQRIAGNGVAVPLTNGVQATAAAVVFPCHVMEDPAGKIYFSESGSPHSRVRSIDTGGLLAAVAGAGTVGPAGDGANAQLALLAFPSGMALDAAGELLFVSDTARIRAVNLTTAPVTWGGLTVGSGQIATLAGSVSDLLYLDAGPASAQFLREASTLLQNADGSLLFPDTGNNVLRRIDAVTGEMTVFAGFAGATTLAGFANVPSGIAAGPDGSIFLSARTGRVLAIDGASATLIAGSGDIVGSGDGGSALVAGVWPDGLTSDGVGNLYLADSRNHRVRFVDDATGLIVTVAGDGGTGAGGGDGGPALNATFNGPYGVVLNSSGTLVFIADNERIRLVNLGTEPVDIGPVQVLADNIDTIVGGNGNGYNGDGGPATSAAISLNVNGGTDHPTGMVVHEFVLYFTDTLNHRIRRVDLQTGILSTVVGTGANTAEGVGTPVGLAILDGHLYWSQLTGNCVRRVSLSGGAVEEVAGDGGVGFAGEGSEARDAQFISPQGLLAGPEGGLFVVDGSHRVRRIQP